MYDFSELESLVTWSRRDRIHNANW
jgi:hypothetical protein